MRSASQTSSAFSTTLPVRTARRTVTFGVVPYSTSGRLRPLSSVNRRGRGRESPWAWPGVRRRLLLRQQRRRGGEYEQGPGSRRCVAVSHGVPH